MPCKRRTSDKRNRSTSPEQVRPQTRTQSPLSKTISKLGNVARNTPTYGKNAINTISNNAAPILRNTPTYGMNAINTISNNAAPILRTGGVIGTLYLGSQSVGLIQNILNDYISSSLVIAGGAVGGYVSNTIRNIFPSKEDREKEAERIKKSEEEKNKLKEEKDKIINQLKSENTESSETIKKLLKIVQIQENIISEHDKKELATLKTITRLKDKNDTQTDSLDEEIKNLENRLLTETPRTPIEPPQATATPQTTPRETEPRPQTPNRLTNALSNARNLLGEINNRYNK